jgi:hypothetical protein
LPADNSGGLIQVVLSESYNGLDPSVDAGGTLVQQEQFDEVILTATPEPACAGLLCVASLLALRRRARS